jgi:uncharacterized small protein (DUF1192 family)
MTDLQILEVNNQVLQQHLDYAEKMIAALQHEVSRLEGELLNERHMSDVPDYQMNHEAVLF